MRRTLKRSITLRTLLVGGVLSIVLVVAFVVLVLATQDQRSAGREALRSQEAFTAGTQLEKSLVDLENGLRGYVASGRERLLEPFQRAQRTYPAQARRLAELVADEPRQQAAVRDIQRQIDDYVNLWVLPLVQLARTDLASARSGLAIGTGRQRLDDLRAAFTALFARERRVAASRERSAERQSDVAVALGFAGVALVLLIAIGLWRYLQRSILRPVRAVAEASETVAAGDLSAHVPEGGEDELGTLARAFNTMTTSLERNRAELDRRTTELERSNQELEQYAQVTSHDLQAPLATVSMYVTLLERRLREAPDSETAELLSGIGASTERMRSLVRDLLQYSRAGRGEVAHVPVEAEELLAHALANLAGPINERNAEIVHGPLPAVLADKGQLSQVFQNVLSNAIKFSDEQSPRVVVTAESEEGMVRFAVCDNGIGIDPRHAELIFEPFQRLHRAERYDGTGIGLAICQKIVASHGGRIWAEGTPGGGSTFYFTVPAAPGDEPAAPPVAEPPLVEHAP